VHAVFQILNHWHFGPFIASVDLVKEIYRVLRVVLDAVVHFVQYLVHSVHLTEHHVQRLLGLVVLLLV